MITFFVVLYTFITIVSVYIYFERSAIRRNKWYIEHGIGEDNYEEYRHNRMTEVNSFLLHLFWPFFILIIIHFCFKKFAELFCKVFGINF